VDEVCEGGQCIDVQGKDYLLYEDFKDNSLGWTLTGQWEIAPAEASIGCSFGNDPGTDHTPITDDNGVAGVNNGGCYTTGDQPDYCFTSPPIDTTPLDEVWVSYWRWLSTEYVSYVYNRFQIWTGSAWTTLWQSSTTSIQDTSWFYQEFNITAYKSTSTQIRWCYDTNSGSISGGGWNVDDVTIGPHGCTPEPYDTCGDGFLDGDDECDGDDLGGMECADLEEYVSGELACTETCAFDTTGCETCGNGVIHGDDECDGDDLGGMTCDDFYGLEGGTLSCNADCTFNTDDCEIDTDPEITVDLTPTTGTLIDSVDDPYWATKGYRITPSSTVDLVGFEWWINQPSSNWMAARLYNNVGTLLASGTQVYGSNVEAWYRSDIAYTLVAGQTYYLVFYNTAASVAIFDYKSSPTMPFTVSPYFTNVESRSIGTDSYPTSVNYWAPFQRAVINL